MDKSKKMISAVVCLALSVAVMASWQPAMCPSPSGAPVSLR